MTGPTESEEPATATKQPQVEDSSLSLSERYQKAIDLTESSPVEAIAAMESMQHEVARLALFSSNEELEDISTKSLPLLALEHFLAMAYTRLPTPPGQIQDRRAHLRKSIDLWANFLQKLESLGDENIVTPAEQKEYQILMECSSHDDNSNGNNNDAPVLPAPRREDKIARFKAKQQAKNEVERLRGLRERRSRVGIPADELMDEFDEETLDRTVAMTNLLLNKAEALEEWAQTIRELPMIERMVQAQAQQNHQERHSGRQSNSNSNNSGATMDARQRPQAPAKGIQVTHVTLDAGNQLQFRKEEIKSQVFRPGWTQPTMSLEEFGDRERSKAIEREQKQKMGEANRAQGPRRYDQLLRDGQEDNADAVDASAALDRAWDDWKDENPRGSGNKRGDQGDRNF